MGKKKRIIWVKLESIELNGKLTIENFVSKKDGSSFNKNFLNIGSGQTSEQSKRALFTIYKDEIDRWTNIPPNLVTTTTTVGIREVFWFSDTVKMVRITEIYPKVGTIYNRTHNTDKWNEEGWKVIVPD